MGRRETAAIIIQIRGGLKAAAEAHGVADGMDHLGDQTRQSGEEAVVAAAAFGRLQRQLAGLARAEALASIATTGMTATMVGLKLAALGLAAIALPALVVAFGQVSAAALVWSVALIAGMGGVLAGAGLMAAGVIGRFQQMKSIVGSAAYDLVGAAGALKQTFIQVAATGADRVMRGIADGLRSLLPLVRSLGPPLGAMATATATMFRTLGRELAGMGPQLRSMLAQLPQAVTALGGLAGNAIRLFVSLATIGLPLAIGALRAISGLMADVAQWFTPDRYRGAVSTLRAFAGAVGTFFSAAAAPLKGVLGPGISEFGQTFMRSLKPLGLIVGTILATFVQLGRAVLPAVAAVIQIIAGAIARVGPALKSVDIASIGSFLASGVRGIASVIATVIPQLVQFGAQLLDAIKPAAPLVTNVLWPLAKGIGEGVLGAIKSLLPFIKIIAVALGWLGQKARPLRGVIEGIGKVLGFVFAGPVFLKGIEMLAKLDGALGVVGKVGVWFKSELKAMVPAIKAVGGFLGRLAGLVGRLLAPFVRFGVAVARFWLKVHIEAARAVAAVTGKLGELVSNVARIGWRVGATLIQGLRSLGGKMVSVGKSLGGHLKDGLMLGLRAIVRGFATVWNNTAGRLHFKIPGWVPGVGGKEFGIPKINADGLASGGTVMRPGAVWVGERGPELLNLPRGSHVMSAAQSAVVATVRHTPIVPARAAAAVAAGTAAPTGRVMENVIVLKVAERELARVVDRVHLDDDGRNT